MITVTYNIKVTDKSNDLCGYVVERKEKFASLPQATAFIRTIRGTSGKGYQLVGNPLIEGK